MTLARIKLEFSALSIRTPHLTKGLLHDLFSSQVQLELLMLSNSVICNDIYEFCFSPDFLKQAELLYNELDLTGRGVIDVNGRNDKICNSRVLL